jgi:hypothetical protein
VQGAFQRHDPHKADLIFTPQTGMPIKSAADKIIREMEMFGPEFDQEPAPVEEVRFAL